MKRPGDGPLSAEQRITEQINKRISDELPWTVTVGIFESAIKRAKALGLN
jgi:GTPase Era involved in 16S rRNA processing